MSKKKLFLALVMIGLIATTVACGKKGTDPNNNIDNPTIPTSTPVIKNEPVANTLDDVVYEYEIDGLNISNVALISSNGKSSFTATVTNIGAADVFVKSFNIILKDASGNELTTLLGAIGEVLSPNEEYPIVANSSVDITKVASVQYVRNY